MKKIQQQLIMLLCCAGAVRAQAQQLSPHIINSGGNYSLSGSVLLEQNIGDFAVTTISTSSFMYTQGFLQPDKGSTTIIPPVQDVVIGGSYLLDNAGTTFINGNIMLEFTSGEIASTTLADANKMLTQGLLQPYPPATTLPVTGLEFFAQRKNDRTVQLDWKTIQEINNKGFHIERKKENESAFIEIGFVAAGTTDGNSTLPLAYTRNDDNNYNGKTFYRLKQEDRNGKTTYSLIRLVNGAGNKQLAMQVWPVPAAGPVQVLVTGLTKADQLACYNAEGKLIKQWPVTNEQPLLVQHLPPGTYFLRLEKNPGMVQKIIIQ